MPFSQIPPASVATDAVAGWQNATWRTLRDNLESFHNHTAGQGKLIPTGGVADAAMTGAKVNDASILSEHLIPTIQHGQDASDINVGTSGATTFDEPLTLSILLPVSCLVEMRYQVKRGVPTGGGGVGWSLQFRVDFVNQATSEVRSQGTIYGGRVFSFFTLLSSGGHILQARWTKLAGTLASETISGPRQFLSIWWGAN